MKLSFATTYPTFDILNWSGTEYYMVKALEEYFEMDYIANVKTDIYTLASFRKLFYNYVKREQYSITRSVEVAQSYAKQIEKRMDSNTDVIFSASSIPIAYLKTNKLKVFYTDATFASMINYYDKATGLSPRTIREGLALEKKALETADLVLYSSEWARQSAINDFNINPNKVKVVSFGANMPSQLNEDQIVANVDKKKREQTCRLLFLGVDWTRKGGSIVVDAVKYLNEVLNQPTELHIVGIENLPLENLPSYITNHGRINKNTEENKKKLENLIFESHFLFLPSRADCTPIVFNEAMSFGVPCISTNTGGISSIIKNNENGILLESDHTFKDYAEVISNVLKNSDNYEKLALSAYRDYKTRLNWDTAGFTIYTHISELL